MVGWSVSASSRQRRVCSSPIRQILRLQLRQALFTQSKTHTCHTSHPLLLSLSINLVSIYFTHLIRCMKVVLAQSIQRFLLLSIVSFFLASCCSHYDCCCCYHSILTIAIMSLLNLFKLNRKLYRKWVWPSKSHSLNHLSILICLFREKKRTSLCASNLKRKKKPFCCCWLCSRELIDWRSYLRKYSILTSLYGDWAGNNI